MDARLARRAPGRIPGISLHAAPAHGSRSSAQGHFRHGFDGARRTAGRRAGQAGLAIGAGAPDAGHDSGPPFSAFVPDLQAGSLGNRHRAQPGHPAVRRPEAGAPDLRRRESTLRADDRGRRDDRGLRPAFQRPGHSRNDHLQPQPGAREAARRAVQCKTHGSRRIARDPGRSRHGDRLHRQLDAAGRPGDDSRSAVAASKPTDVRARSFGTAKRRPRCGRVRRCLPVYRRRPSRNSRARPPQAHPGAGRRHAHRRRPGRGLRPLAQPARSRRNAQIAAPSGVRRTRQAAGPGPPRAGGRARRRRRAGALRPSPDQPVAARPQHAAAAGGRNHRRGIDGGSAQTAAGRSVVTPGLERRLEQAVERFEEIERLLAEPELADDPRRFTTLSREYSELQGIVDTWRAIERLDARQAEAREMLAESDADMRKMANEELAEIEIEQEQLDRQLQRLIVPPDPNDRKNLFLEIRAGTGGQEAALFAGDLFRMYGRFAESQGWRVEILSGQQGEAGGWRELIARVIGNGAYSKLKFESGTHRVQRVPATESQGRIHTSACTVAILPEVAEIDAIDINPNDLRIDTYRSSGAGGQHVNTTDSAIRITHLPSGIVVECQDERSQHKNKARALSLLSSRLLESERASQRSQQAADRKVQVGSGDRSERIRTYNYPQGRVTDHRIGLTLYELDAVLGGALESVIDPLTEAHQEELLAEMSQS